MREVEPQGNDPHEIEHRVNRAVECLLNPAKAIGGSRCGGAASELGEHHVGPEVVEVEQKAYHDDKAEHQHVLRCPRHLGATACHLVALWATSPTVLSREDERVNDVAHCQEGKAKRSQYCVPVASQELAYHVVGIPREECGYVHAAVEGQEENEADASERHHHLSTNRRID